MGWTIYRVWSTYWFDEPRRETQKLVSFLEQLLNQKSGPEGIVDGLPWGAVVGQSICSAEGQTYAPVEPTLEVEEPERLGQSEGKTTSGGQQHIVDQLDEARLLEWEASLADAKILHDQPRKNQ